MGEDQVIQVKRVKYGGKYKYKPEMVLGNPTVDKVFAGSYSGDDISWSKGNISIPTMYGPGLTSSYYRIRQLLKEGKQKLPVDITDILPPEESQVLSDAFYNLN